MRKHEADKAKNQLAQIIKDQIATDPVERGGVQWARVHQEPLADHLGLSVDTLRSWTGAPPFQREVALIDGTRSTLLRVLADGEAPVITPQRMANRMREIWKAKVGTKLDCKQHGCLIGLAQVWPQGHQDKIFKLVLDDWPAFMTAVKLSLYAFSAKHGLALKNAEPLDSAAVKLGLKPDQGPLPEGLEIRFLKYPSITFMRPFYLAGVELYVQHLQLTAPKTGQKPALPPAVASYLDALSKA